MCVHIAARRRAVCGPTFEPSARLVPKGPRGARAERAPLQAQGHPLLRLAHRAVRPKAARPLEPSARPAPKGPHGTRTERAPLQAQGLPLLRLARRAVVPEGGTVT